MNLAVHAGMNAPAFEAALQLHHRGDLDAAQAAYSAILAAQPRHAGALLGLGLIAHHRGDGPRALDLLQEARQVAPRDPAVLNNLGLALAANGRDEEALATWRRVLTIAPRHVDALVNLANADARAGRSDSALQRYRAALAADARSVAAAANLGGLLVARREFSEAVLWLERAAALAAGNADILVNLGRAYSECGLAAKARAALEAAVRARPGDAAACANLLMALHYCDDVDAGQIAAAHRAWARTVEPNGPAPRPAIAAERPRRFRTGLLSGDFNDHAVMRFLAPLLERHDPARDELRCYYTGWREDAYTASARGWADAFVSVAGLTDAQLARRLRDDDLDVLLDLSGHSAGGRARVLAMRPAPLQATWLGYLDTTGLASVDFRLTDAIADPPGLTEVLHTEKLWRMTAMWCYRPRGDAPACTPGPAQRAQGITFGSTNNPAKLSDATLALWAEVLERVPESRIVVHAHDDPLCRERVAKALAARAIAAGRVSTFGRESAADYLSRYAAIDILLDTTPYSGGTTTCDALWMGVPVVTLAGDRPFSRTSASVLHAAGLPEWVATDRAAFVRIAGALAADPAALALWRRTLRARVAASRLCDEEAMVEEFSTTLRSLWAAAGLPPRETA
jgi:protein O-GlcNAc transferase